MPYLLVTMLGSICSGIGIGYLIGSRRGGNAWIGGYETGYRRGAATAVRTIAGMILENPGVRADKFPAICEAMASELEQARTPS